MPNDGVTTFPLIPGYPIRCAPKTQDARRGFYQPHSELAKGLTQIPSVGADYGENPYIVNYGENPSIVNYGNCQESIVVLRNWRGLSALLTH